MANISKFKTSHQIAKELLALPDRPVAMPVPTFDMPGCNTAFPVRVEAAKVEGVDMVLFLADGDALVENEPTEKRDAGNPQSPHP